MPPNSPQAFAVKAAIADPHAENFSLIAQKSMYGGKHAAAGAPIYVFASENAGGPGLIARGVVTAAVPVPRHPGIPRQTPRVTLTIARTALAKRPLGRAGLKRLTTWNDGQPGTELNFKLYRQATDKVIGISAAAAAFLADFF